LPPPKTTEEWKALSEQSVSSEQASARELAKLREHFGVTVVPKILGGVRCYEVTPKFVSLRNRDRLILNLHHGGFIWGGGESGTEWAIELAGLMGYRVLVVDYRLLPDHPFPAALDDAVSVWKEVIKATKPSNIAVLGGSAGGGLVLSLIQKVKSDHLPLPGAVVSISPSTADLSKTGDSYYTNDGVDGTISYDGFWEAAHKLYANGRDLKDPLVSPLYGDFEGFPPTYLVTGTRDLFLSSTVRAQRKLLQAGVSTQLEVLEGLPHPGFLLVDIPEVRDMYSHVAQFIDAHLGH
jgi:acetyl esterase/lipase